MPTLEHAKRQARTIKFLVVGLALSFIFLASTATYFFVEGQNQGADINKIQVQTSACREDPEGLDCLIGHSNSVALTTRDEACFIVALAGYRCRQPDSRITDLYRKNLEQLADDLNSDNPDPNDPRTETNPTAPDSSGKIPSPPSTPVKPPAENPSPEPNNPAPPDESPPAQKPPTPSEPAASSPIITNPLKPAVELCVSAAGVKVIC